MYYTNIRVCNTPLIHVNYLGIWNHYCGYITRYNTLGMGSNLINNGYLTPNATVYYTELNGITPCHVVYITSVNYTVIQGMLPRYITPIP